MLPVVAVGAVCGVQGVVGNALCATEQSSRAEFYAYPLAVPHIHLALVGSLCVNGHSIFPRCWSAPLEVDTFGWKD